MQHVCDIDKAEEFARLHVCDTDKAAESAFSGESSDRGSVGGGQGSVGGGQGNGDLAQVIIAGIHGEMQAGFGRLMKSYQDLRDEFESLQFRLENLEDALLCKVCCNVREDVQRCGCVSGGHVFAMEEQEVSGKARRKQARLSRRKKAQAEKLAGVETTDGECPTFASAKEGKACHTVLGAEAKPFWLKSVGTGGGEEFCDEKPDETRSAAFKSHGDVGCSGSREV